MLETISALAPSINPFVHSIYATPSSLSRGTASPSLHPPVSGVLCDVLDDITLNGSTEEILHDLEVIKSLAEIALILNSQKSEISVTTSHERVHHHNTA